jgi:hypothetical protein
MSAAATVADAGSGVPSLAVGGRPRHHPAEPAPAHEPDPPEDIPVLMRLLDEVDANRRCACWC